MTTPSSLQFAAHSFKRARAAYRTPCDSCRNSVRENSLALAVNKEDGDRSGELMGLRIRALRHQRGLSVNELAAKAGVSSGIVSQIERGKANPSLRTLESIRTALGVPLSAILEEMANSGAPRIPFVRRANDRPHFDVGTYPLRKEHLSPTGSRDLEMMIIHFPPGSQSEDVVIGDGEKAGMVLSGQVKLIVGEASTTLFEGDSFQFDSNIAHKVINEAGSGAMVLWIMSQLRSKPHL